MATHTQLPIYKAAYDLLDVSTDFVKNMPRDFKRSIGEKITNECIEITIAVFRANVAQDKAPHLMDLLERLQVAELMIRLAMDHRAEHQHRQADQWVAPQRYAPAPWRPRSPWLSALSIWSSRWPTRPPPCAPRTPQAARLHGPAQFPT